MKNSVENTPAHCHDCHAFADCRQAQNMVADNPPVEGWVHHGEVYCAGCGGDGTLYEGPTDYPVHCAGCGVPIIHELTVDGVEYVRDSLADDGGCCREVWPTVWGIVSKIPVDSIVIPGRFVEVCEGWAGDTDCMLRTISSTGNLTTGTHRPRGCDSDEKWYLTIWRNLSADVNFAKRSAQLYNGSVLSMYADCANLVEFDAWVDEQIERLEESYGLADWDACDD